VRIIRLAELVAAERQEVTGHAIDVPEFGSWPVETADSSTFAALVTECYKWLRESWEQDVKLLRDHARDAGVVGRAVRDLTADVHALRTARQHSDNADAVRRAERWFRDSCGLSVPSTPDEWLACGAQLLSEVERALEELVGLARAVAGDPSAAEAWQRMVGAATSNDPLAEREIVAADLGIALPRNRVGYIDRQIEWEWNERHRALTAGDDASLELTRVVERFLVGWSLSDLPCHYAEVLERAAVEPGPDALVVVRLAHVIADLVDYGTIDEFLDQFEAVWRTLRTE